MFVQYWAELDRPVKRWLGSVYREDDGSQGEVAFLMVRRINGGGGLVRVLRGVPPGDANERRVTFAHTRLVCAEVVREALKHRPWRAGLTDTFEEVDNDDG